MSNALQIKSRLTVSFLLLMVLFGIGMVLLGRLAPQTPVKVYNLQAEGGGWLAYPGDLPLSPDGRTPQDPGAWRPLSEVAPDYAGKRYTGYFWLKRTLPAGGEWTDPHLFIRNLKSYELFLGDRRLSSFNIEPYDTKVNPYFQWSMFPLRDYAGQTVLLRVYNDDRGLSAGYTVIGNGSELWSRMIKRDLNNLILGTMFMAITVMSLALFLYRRTQQAYLFFSLFAFSAGYACLSRAELTAVLLDNPLWNYLHDLAFPLATFAFLAFLDALYGSGWRHIRRKMWQGMLAFTIVVFGVAMTDELLYRDMIQTVFPPVFLLVALVSGGMTAALYRERRDRETLWILIGFSLLLGAAAFHSLLLLSPELLNWLLQRFPRSFANWSDQIFGAVFFFILCLGMVLLQRFSEVHRTVRQYAEELQRQNVRLEELDKLKDAFLANTSHELRTPLNGMIGLTESLLDGAAGPLGGKVRDHLELVAASGRRLAYLVSDILDFSKLKHHDLPLQLRPVSLQERADLVLTVFSPLAERRGLRLRQELPAGLPQVLADGDRLEQILYNLIGNAIKFTPAGEVVLGARVLDDALEVSVRDTGIGIAPHKLEAIFTAFEQAEASPAREYGGTGLGLSITRQLVELHGGRIHAEPAVGAGSVFRFTLPLWRSTGGEDQPDAGSLPGSGTLVSSSIGARLQIAAVDRSSAGEDGTDGPGLPLLFRPDGSAAAAEETGGNAPARPRARILIVDDEPLNLQVLSSFLALQHYDVRQASSGSEALACVEQERPDLILLDVMMPWMSGYEVCRELRRTYQPGELPILLITARNQVEDLVEGFDAGANDYLSKPVMKRELIARVELQLQLLQLHHSLEGLVRERTAELTETGDQLRSSLRETAEAMAELSVIEERARIARDIHDIVGHTLTTTVIQMEAAKRLIVRQDDLGMQKLDLSQELVRKSLNEIRQSVSTLSAGTGEYDLAGALLKLIEEARRNADIEIEHEIAAPLPPLSVLQKKVLYHALQEGLTNGLRHGGGQRFRFRLSQAGRLLHFTLFNEGRPYCGSPMGFGLSTMKERVQQLGGSMSLAAGTEGGCLLNIELPVE